MKGRYKDGKVELLEPMPENIRQADLRIIVTPYPSGDTEKSKALLKTQVFQLVKDYYELIHRPQQEKEFVPGESRINYGGRVFDEREITALVDSSLDFWLTAGPYTERFERQFAEKIGVKYCCMVNSGSSANLLAFATLTSPMLGERQIKAGDEVITTAAGFPTTVTPILQAGAVPVFVDVTIPEYNIDISKLKKAVSTKTKAVIIAHTLGNPFDLSALTEFCKKHSLWLIEDNCDSLGSLYDNKMTGSFGDMGTSSFYPPHHITTGEGGAVYTDNALLKRIMLSMRDWGRDCFCPSGIDNSCKKRFTQQLGTLPFAYDHKYTYSHFGYNLKATDLQAAIGCVQIEKLDDFIVSRRKNWQILADGFEDLKKFFILPKATPNSIPSWFGFMVTVRDEAPFVRDDIVNYLEKHHIQTRMLFAGNFIRQPAFDQFRKDSDVYRVSGGLDNTDIVMTNSFWLGVYPGLSEPMLSYIIKKIHDFVKNYRKEYHESFRLYF